MNAGGREIDIAMVEDRPPKLTMRELWADEVERSQVQAPGDERPIYLTLPGRYGKDIEKLIEVGIIHRTEAGGIVQEDMARLVAVERDNNAVLELQKNFPGLNILEMDFDGLIQGVGLMDWPQDDQRQYCRATVVNLDLNGPLRANATDGQPIFPVLQWVRKLCQIHGEEPRQAWTLLLTLNGNCVWSTHEVDDWISEFLRSNAAEEPQFGEGLRQFFGDDLFTHISDGDAVVARDLRLEDQRRLVMILVPKVIALHVGPEGWRLEVARVLGYGGNGTAPMATWILRFKPEAIAGARQPAMYRQSLMEIVQQIGRIDDDGNLVDFA